jgi:hypothetical protein
LKEADFLSTLKSNAHLSGSNGEELILVAAVGSISSGGPQPDSLIALATIRDLETCRKIFYIA